MALIPIGSKVVISLLSRFYREQGKHGVGVIVQRQKPSHDLPYVVKFDDGYQNTYGDDDLVIKEMGNEIGELPRSSYMLK
jgi:hypothetical protein